MFSNESMRSVMYQYLKAAILLRLKVQYYVMVILSGLPENMGQICGSLHSGIRKKVACSFKYFEQCFTQGPVVQNFV